MKLTLQSPASLLSLIAFAAGIALSSATSAVSLCTQHFAGARAPQINNAALARSATELCNQSYASVHSGESKTPIYTAEYLTRRNLEGASEQVRVNNFRADNRLPRSSRAELADYSRSGFDRGHLAPSGNMPDEQSQSESFLLSNIIPQDPVNNRNLWSGIESTTRLLAKRSGELYVVTGVMFKGSRLNSIGGRVLVPTHLFKALYDPKTGEAAAYIATNDSTGRYASVSIKALENLSGIKTFPGVNTRDREMSLPSPFTRGSTKTKFHRVDVNSLFDDQRSIHPVKMTSQLHETSGAFGTLLDIAKRSIHVN
jgi:endonuclease G, mitochondrial